MAWVLTAALAALRADFNTAFPSRDHASDGTIGDPAHQAETSGHNPDDTPGVSAEYADADSVAEVRAFDCDNDFRDPRGIGMQQVIDKILVTPADRGRLRYIIYNRRIWSRNTNWGPRPYTGSNPHDKHAHFSGDPLTDADASPWLSVLSFGADMALTPADLNSIGLTVWNWDLVNGPNVGLAYVLVVQAATDAAAIKVDTTDIKNAIAALPSDLAAQLMIALAANPAFINGIADQVAAAVGAKVGGVLTDIINGSTITGTIQAPTA